MANTGASAFTLTKAGLNAIVSQISQARVIQFIEVALSDQYTTPSDATTALTREKERFPVAISRPTDTRVSISARVDSRQSYPIREIGVYVDNGLGGKVLLGVTGNADPVAFASPESSFIINGFLEISALKGSSVQILGPGERVELSLAVEFATLSTTILGIQRLIENMEDKMTLESVIATLTGEANRLLEQVRTSLAAYTAEVIEIREAAGVDFYVSKTVRPSNRADNSVQAIQAKIESLRQNGNNDPITVLVQSFTDVYPLRITSSNLEIRFQYSSRLSPPNGTTAIEIAGDQIILRNAFVRYASRAEGNLAFSWAKPRTPGEYLEIRTSTAINANALVNDTGRIDTAEIREGF
jgi:hypothetical protein